MDIIISASLLQVWWRSGMCPGWKKPKFFFLADVLGFGFTTKKTNFYE